MKLHPAPITASFQLCMEVIPFAPHPLPHPFLILTNVALHHCHRRRKKTSICCRSLFQPTLSCFAADIWNHRAPHSLLITTKADYRIALNRVDLVHYPLPFNKSRRGAVTKEEKERAEVAQIKSFGNLIHQNQIFVLNTKPNEPRYPHTHKPNFNFSPKTTRLLRRRSHFYSFILQSLAIRISPVVCANP